MCRLARVFAFLSLPHFFCRFSSPNSRLVSLPLSAERLGQHARLRLAFRIKVLWFAFSIESSYPLPLLDCDSAELTRTSTRTFVLTL